MSKMLRNDVEDNKIHENDNDCVENYVKYVQNESLDDDTKYVTCLSSIFPNTDDNPVEYIYTRDASGRVVDVVCRLKVPPNEEEFIHTANVESGRVINVQRRFKKTAEEVATKNEHARRSNVHKK
jgi:GTPase SAR1 family protein